ncbi:MAG TPA: UDP-N-acetylglucosamine--N-acetylmuramyl-(pentapeptide) pyrophosphoryl-undecaprenol N-acetylglucosamine transferase [Gemmatimonadaceae bacterium]|nr:UDP-N-acetylglucosamine--N-acetylmuramyl-(pentapeptide) pyrophosphoryl-undecaprenol N-acetylglucosamine transferase [Gemmatimonadaceae bacterium]
MRILLAGGGTGGHLYPGLAIARALVRQDPAAQPFFVGARRGIERDVLPTTEFPHVLLDLHPIYRSRPWQNWRTLTGMTSAWRALGTLVSDEQPRVVVGTGGYASGATLAYAATHRIPLALQEQNSHPGITTRLFARYAREVYLGYAEAAKMLRISRSAWIGETGNPITPPPNPRPKKEEARAIWRVPDGARVLLIVGGSQGARALNDVVDGWLSRGIPENLFVIWATGRGSHERHAPHESAYVRVVPYLSPIEEAYAASDLALTRAGALTLAELCAWGIPSLLVPLPTAAADHQTSNAKALASAGAAVLVPQSALTVERLDRTIRELLGQPERLSRIASAARARGRPDAAETIARRILTLAHLNQVQT